MLKHLSQSCWLTDSKTLKQEFHFSFVQALNGHGIDRHLLGLKLQAIEEGMSIPKIFMDTAYGLATHFKLRTGQVCVCLCSRCYLHLLLSRKWEFFLLLLFCQMIVAIWEGIFYQIISCEVPVNFLQHTHTWMLGVSSKWICFSSSF